MCALFTCVPASVSSVTDLLSLLFTLILLTISDSSVVHVACLTIAFLTCQPPSYWFATSTTTNSQCSSMSHYMYGSEARYHDVSYSRVLRLVEDDGRISCVCFCYEWEAAEWKEKYVSVKQEYAQLTRAYRNWDLTKKEYTRELKHVWLEVASDFVKELSDRDRDLIPLDLRVMIHDARTLYGYPTFCWPVILHVTDNGYGNLVFPVEWDVLGRSA